MPADGKELISKLQERKICLKGPFGKIPFNGHLRITVGNEEQMLMLCREIEGLMKTSVGEKVKL